MNESVVTSGNAIDLSLRWWNVRPKPTKTSKRFSKRFYSWRAFLCLAMRVLSAGRQHRRECPTERPGSPAAQLWAPITALWTRSALRRPVVLDSDSNPGAEVWSDGPPRKWTNPESRPLMPTTVPSVECSVRQRLNAKPYIIYTYIILIFICISIYLRESTPK